jgi:hypothetical protein
LALIIPLLSMNISIGVSPTSGLLVIVEEQRALHPPVGDDQLERALPETGFTLWYL